MFHSNKIEVRKSPLQGYGVFTKEDIKSGELLEECHYLEVPDDERIARYYYNWPRGEKFQKYTVPLGFGCIYNGISTSGQEANVEWTTDVDKDIFIYTAIKDIKKGNELLLDYDYGEY